MDEQDLRHVVAHEQAHIRRRDHWWKPLGFLLLTIHWFNPLMWLAYMLLCRDIELACDEKVIKELGNKQRADYTQALVACSVNRRMIAACPLAFGEVGVKERVKSVMNYKKPAFWVIILAVIACVIVAVCFLTNPVGFQFDEATHAIVSANHFDMRHADDAVAVEMNLAQISELSSRLSTVKNTKKSDEYGGFTPGYQISALLEDGTYIRISGYSLSENDMVDIEWNGDRYVVSDSDFQDYLSRICAGEDVTAVFAGFTINQPYGVVEVTYESPLTSFSMVAQQNTPEYLMDENGHLFSIREYSEAPDWTELGQLSEITITKENFDELFRNNSGEGWFNRESASAIRSNTAKAWSVIYDQERLYYILQQKNGELYLAYGYYDYSEKDDPGSDDTYIRWLYKLAPQDLSVSASVTKWYDYLEAPNEMHSDHPLEITLPEFPDVSFRASSGSMEAVKGDEVTQLYTGMPIWNTYFCDLSGDGLPELCSTLSWGSGMIDNRVMIYDYANGVSYSLEDRGVSDYTLRQDESDGQLYVDKKAHLGGGLLSTGRLVFEDDCLQVLWPEKPNDNIREITDPTDDPNFAYDTAVEKIFEDANNEYFIGGLYSQHIIVHYTDGTQEDIVTALNAGRATFADLNRFGIRYWAEPKADPLEAAISSAILDHYASKQPDGRLHVESHVLLANEVKSGTPLMGADNHIEEVTVYLLVFHEKYSTYGGTPEAVGGSYVPTAITFSVSESEEYTLKEYWEPRDGSYYAKDVQEKFPGASAEDALNGQVYIEDLQAQNYSKVLAYLNDNGGLEIRIAELLDTICASPGVFASSPAQYIEAHEAEYQELLDYREYTLRFCFSEFLRGGQTDLRSHIMRAAIDDIAPEAQLRLHAETGQAYFDEWKAAALRVSEQHEMEWIEKNQPAIYLLLQMLDSEMVADADAETPQMSFAGLQYGDAMIDEEYIEIQADGTTLEYQITYSSASIVLEIGLIAEDGTEMIHMIESGSAKGKFEDIPVGKYQLFVRNVGYQNDLFGKAVEGGALVCKFDYGT